MRAQIRAVLEDFPVRAVKTGALGSAAIIRVVADELRGKALPLIVDPVMLAKSGDSLLEPSAVQALRQHLFPLATLVTPNLPEAERLLELEEGFFAEERPVHEMLSQRPAFPMLLKGGHGSGDVLHDHLWLASGTQTWSSARQNTRHTHGTGCTLSAAIAANLARGVSLEAAVESARHYVQRAISGAPELGSGRGPLEHFPD